MLGRHPIRVSRAPASAKENEPDGQASRLPRHIYGVLGMPLAHSLSPTLHNWAFARTGLPGVYLPFEKGVDELPAFMSAVRSLPFSGLSVTLPYKEAVLPFLDGLTERARRVGAVNTLFWEEKTLWGDNTDVAGFLSPLDSFFEGFPRPTALVLGAGGAARAVLAGLREKGVENIILAARTAEKGVPLAQEFGARALIWENRGAFISRVLPNLVINATPLGTRGISDASPLTAEDWPSIDQSIPGILETPHLAYDLVYRPLRTRFLDDAAQKGWSTMDGLNFFVSQGLAQFKLWTGRDLPAEEARTMLQGLL